MKTKDKAKDEVAEKTKSEEEVEAEETEKTENDIDGTDGDTDTDTDDEGEGGGDDGNSEGAEAESERSMYDRVADLSGIAFDPEEHDDVDHYKRAVVTHFGKLEDEDFDRIAKSNEDIAEWVNESTRVVKDNRAKPKGEKKSPLPHLPGLPGDEPPTKKGKAKAAPKEKAAKKEKVKKEPKPPKEKTVRSFENNRYFRIAQLMIKKPTMTKEQLGEAAAAANVDYNVGTLSHGFDAFNAVCLALRQAGQLK